MILHHDFESDHQYCTKSQLSRDPSHRSPARSISEVEPQSFELIAAILELYAAEPGLILEAGRIEDTAQCFHCLSTLMHRPSPLPLRFTAARAQAAACRTMGRKEAISDAQLIAIGSVPWQALLAASSLVLFILHGGLRDHFAEASDCFRETALAVSGLLTLRGDGLGSTGQAGASIIMAGLTVLSVLLRDPSAVNGWRTATDALTRLVDSVTIVEQRDHLAEDLKMLHDLLPEIGRLPDATGRQQQQRQITRLVGRSARPSRICSWLWRGLADDLARLLQGLLNPTRKGYSQANGTSPHVEDRPNEEEVRLEWQHVNAALTTLAHVALIDLPPSPQLSILIGTGQLPSAYEAVSSLESVEQYLRSSMSLLTSKSIFVRDCVKESLGSDLSLQLLPALIKELTS